MERIADAVAGPLEGVTRLVRRRRLRWLFLVEFPLWLAFVAALLACLLVVAVLALLGDSCGS